jgi:CBS domain-containing protein
MRVIPDRRGCRAGRTFSVEVRMAGEHKRATKKGEGTAPGRGAKSEAPADEAAPGSTPLDVEPDSRRTSDISAPRRGVRVEELMTAEVVQLPPGRPVSEAARVMAEYDVGFLPVTESDRTVVGVVTDRDLTLRVLGEGRSADTPLEEVMSEEVVSCYAGDDLGVCELLMRENQVSRLVVLGDEDLLAGVISLSDLAQYEDERRAGELLADVTEREAEH